MYDTPIDLDPIQDDPRTEEQIQEDVDRMLEQEATHAIFTRLQVPQSVVEYPDNEFYDHEYWEKVVKPEMLRAMKIDPMTKHLPES